MVVRPQRQGRTLLAAPLAQVQDVGLQAMQQRFAVGFGESVPLGSWIGLQQVDEIPPLLAEGGQQRIADRQIGVLRVGFLAQPGQIAFGPDVAPVFLAGIQHEQMQIHMTRQFRQQVQVQRWQRRHADDGDPLRQAAAIEIAIVQRLAELFLHSHPVRRARPRQPSPQFGLPVVLLARFPLLDPVRAINQVLIETVGDTASQFVAAKIVAVVTEVGIQGCKAWRVFQLPQQRHHPPDQHWLIERRGRRQLTQYRPAHFPEKSRWKLERQIGADPQALGQAQRQPAGHAVALGDHDLPRQRCAQRPPQYLGQLLGQDFKLVTLIAVKHEGVPWLGEKRGHGLTVTHLESGDLKPLQRKRPHAAPTAAEPRSGENPARCGR